MPLDYAPNCNQIMDICTPYLIRSLGIEFDPEFDVINVTMVCNFRKATAHEIEAIVFPNTILNFFYEFS